MYQPQTLDDLMVEGVHFGGLVSYGPYICSLLYKQIVEEEDVEYISKEKIMLTNGGSQDSMTIPFTLAREVLSRYYSFVAYYSPVKMEALITAFSLDPTQDPYYIPPSTGM